MKKIMIKIIKFSKNEFFNCENEKDIKKIKDSFKNVNNLLKSLNIKTNISDIRISSNLFNVKEKNKSFILGINKDNKIGRLIDTNELFKGTPFEFLINQEQNKK